MISRLKCAACKSVLESGQDWFHVTIDRWFGGDTTRSQADFCETCLQTVTLPGFIIPKPVEYKCVECGLHTPVAYRFSRPEEPFPQIYCPTCWQKLCAAYVLECNAV